MYRQKERFRSCFSVSILYYQNVSTMTLAKQLKQYQDEWVLIEYTKLDENLNVKEGQIIAHSPNKDKI